MAAPKEIDFLALDDDAIEQIAPPPRRSAGVTDEDHELSLIHI